ncbi:MAG: hypothetical protein ABS938_17805 [Psychrobacillus psychrodurans]
MEISLTKFTDIDGCITLQCKHCGDKFKVNVQEFEDFQGEFMFCASCGLEDYSQNFILTEDFQKNAQIELENLALRELQKMFGKKNVKGKLKTPTDLFEVNDMHLILKDCCNRQVKINNSANFASTYCPYCGGI